MADDDIPHVINEDTITALMKLNPGVKRETIIGGMHASGWPDAKASTTSSKSWGEISKSLDPMMPAPQYNAIRGAYFQSSIAPGLKPEEMRGTRAEFMRRTERLPLMGDSERLAAHVGVALTTGLSRLPGGKGWEEPADEMSKMLVRDGADPRLARLAGGLVGDAAVLAPMFAVGGPAIDALTGSFLKGAKGAHTMMSMARGGVIFGAFDAMSADEGSRMSAGVKGFAVGAVAEGLLSPFTKAAAAETVRRPVKGLVGAGGEEAGLVRKGTGFTRVARPDPGPTDYIDVDVIPPQQLLGPKPGLGFMRGLNLDTYMEQVEAAKKEGAMAAPPIVSGSGTAMKAVVKGGGETVPLTVKAGMEDDFLNALDPMLKKGGSLETMQVGPGAITRASSLMARLAEKANPDKVPLPPEYDRIRFPDMTHADLYRAGEIRSQVIESGQGIGEKVPREVHEELHNTLGNVGERLGIPRANAGDLALDYYTKMQEVKPSLQGWKGVAPRYDVAGEVKPIQERMVEKGITQEGRPDKGYKTRAMADIIPRQEQPTPPKYARGLRAQTEGPTMIRGREELPDRVRGFTTGSRVTLAEDASRDEVYHEYLHRGFFATRTDVSRVLREGSGLRPALMIANGLKKVGAYKGRTTEHLLEEAVTHVMTALRMGDMGALQQLAEMDTSIEAVTEMAGSTARDVLDRMESLPDGGGLSGRIMQRRMADIIRRSSTTVSKDLNNGLGLVGAEGWFDPALKKWIVRDSEGKLSQHQQVEDVWDWLEDTDPSPHGPNTSFMADLAGVSGPGMPREGVPNGTIPNPDPDIPGRGISWLSGTLGFRPMIGWVAALDGKINKVLASKGLDKLGLFDKWKAVDSAHLEGQNWALGEGSKVSKILRDVAPGRRPDIGEVLSAGKEHETTMMDALRFTDKERQTVTKMREWMGSLKQGTDVDLERVLSDLREARANGVNKGMHSAVKSGHLNPSDLHIGKLSDWAIRRGMQEKFMATPLGELDELVRQNGGTLGVTKPFLQKYITHMRSIPDSTQSGVNAFAKDMLGGIGKMIGKVNKTFGLNLKDDLSGVLPQDVMQKAMLFQYAMGLGGRAAVFVRDTYQMVNAMSVVGGTAFARGLSKAVTPEGWKMAQEAGALLSSTDFGGDLAGVTEGKPTQVMKALLWPSKAGHNIGRAATYHAEYEQATRAIDAFKSGGSVDTKALFNNTTMWWLRDSQRTRLVDIIGKSTTEDAAKQVALDVVDATQWALRKGTQPALMQTGLGRVLGQYGQWPMNYMSYVGNMARLAVENPAKGLPALGKFIAVQSAAVAAAESMGADVSKWVFLSPMGYRGSPTVEMLTHLYGAAEESDQGRADRKAVLNYATEFIPGGVEAKAAWKIINEPGMNDNEKWVRLLGFKPLKETESLDWEAWAKWEAGFGRSNPSVGKMLGITKE